VLRVGDKYVVLVSQFSHVDVRDVRTGVRVAESIGDHRNADFKDAVALDDHTLALMRDGGDGVTIERIELTGRGMVTRLAAFMPRCD
jgi:hypothetical protein